jgi:hypothetical protein
MKEMSLVEVQNILQKNIMCRKEFEKNMQEWEMICKEVGLRSWKLKTLIKTKFVSKVILF